MASPTDGQANDAVRDLLAKRLAIAPSRIALVKGLTSRQKQFDIEGLDLSEIERRLTEE